MKSRIDEREVKGWSRGLSRRDFIRISSATTGGLLISFHLPGAANALSAEATADTVALNAYVRIDPDNTVTIVVPKSDMGQGVRTSLAMIVADELDADWSHVRVEQAPLDTDRYGSQATGGSSSIRTRWQELRQVGATARTVLVQVAAQRWGVEPAACRTERGAVIHPSSGRRAQYGELVAEAAHLPVPDEVPLKEPSEFHIVGQPTRGVDVSDIVVGRAQYGMDVRVPGMLYAVVERCPVFGGRVAGFDASRAERVPGVRAVVEVPPIGKPTNIAAGVAVVAENTWAALKGREALDVTWDEGPHAGESSEGYLEQMRRMTEQPARVVFDQGNVDARLAEGSDRRIEAVYEFPFLAHATMEPMNCTAHVDGNRCTLWSPTQFPDWAAEAAAEALGIPQENVAVNVTLLGGGFGRRANPDFSAEAAYISRAVAAPVKVVWTREDDMGHDFYRPMALHRVEAVLGADGRPEALRHRVASTPIGATYGPEDDENIHHSEVEGVAEIPYRVPHRRCEYANVKSPVPRGWWRSVGHTHTAFAIESFIDELAAAAGMDPYQYRVDLFDLDVEASPEEEFPYEPQRLLGVLKLAAERAGWGAPLPDGVGRGIACHWSFRSYAAEVVEASVDDNGRVTVHRVVAAVDCGTVINPSGAEAQVQGAIVDGLSAALKLGITLENGRVVQSNFHDYEPLRMHEIPGRIEVHFVPSTARPTGLGEPALPPVGPALANAIYAATGIRVRSLPIGRVERQG